MNACHSCACTSQPCLPCRLPWPCCWQPTAWRATACCPARRSPPGTAFRARRGAGARPAQPPPALPASADLQWDHGPIPLICAGRRHLSRCPAPSQPNNLHVPPPGCCRSWGTYCRFALPSVAMLCCEWSTFEVRRCMRGCCLQGGELGQLSVCPHVFPLMVFSTGPWLMACALPARPHWAGHGADERPAARARRLRIHDGPRDKHVR